MVKRREVLEKDCWKLEDMLENDQAWEELYQKEKEEICRYAQFKGHMGESADQLYAALKFDDECSQRLEVLYVYARMRMDQDTGEARYQEMFARAQSLSSAAAEQTSYMAPEILAIPEERLQEFMRSDNGIRHFSRAIEQLLAKKPHTLNREMEELLAQSQEATQGAAQIFTMFNNADISFPTITGSDGESIAITHGNYISLLESEDRRVRKDAFTGLDRKSVV